MLLVLLLRFLVFQELPRETPEVWKIILHKTRHSLHSDHTALS